MLDLLIRGGRVIDGAGNPWYTADVGIAGDRIASVGRLAGEPAARTIEADGLFVCPGFVDMHTHSDLQLLASPPHEAKVHQGVTLEVLGQDGLSYAPVTDEVLEELRGQLAGWNDDPPGFDWNWRTVGEYLDRLDADGIAVNAAYLAPHGTIRMCAMGYDDRAPTDDELAHMKRLLAEALDDGAVGLSTGLTYTPGMYADDDELVALLEVVREHGGFYSPHHRNYGRRALEAYADCIEVSRRAGVPLRFAHAHLGYAINKGRAPELLAMIDRARDDGVEVTMDTYPYLAGSTYLHAFLPSWMHVGGSGATIERLRDPELRERLRVEMEDEGSDGFHEIPMDWSIVVISGARLAENRRYIGLSVGDAASLADARPIDFFCDLLAAEELGVSCVSQFGQRGERADDDDAPRTHRRERRHPRRRAAASALVRHLPALLRRLHQGARDPHVGAGGAQDDVALGATARLPGSRAAPTGHGGRRHLHRSRDGSRRCDLRGPTSPPRGDPVRDRERRCRRRRRASHRSARGTGAEGVTDEVERVQPHQPVVVEVHAAETALASRSTFARRLSADVESGIAGR